MVLIMGTQCMNPIIERNYTQRQIYIFCDNRLVCVKKRNRYVLDYECFTVGYDKNIGTKGKGKALHSSLK